MAIGKIGQLEFGRELEFFRTHGAKQAQGPEMKSFKALYYELTLDDAKLQLVEHADMRVPILISLIQGHKVIKVSYSLWEDRIPFRSELFDPPAGLKFEEQQ